MARYEVASLRLEVETSRRLTVLAAGLGVPRTVLMRRMIVEMTDLAFALSDGPPENSQKIDPATT